MFTPRPVLFSLLVALASEAEAQPPERQDRPSAAEGKPKLMIDTRGFTSPVNSIDFSPRGDWLAAAGSDKVVRIWDIATGRLLWTVRGYDDNAGNGQCCAVRFSPDGRSLLVGVKDFTTLGTIRVYDAADLSEIRMLLPTHTNGGAGELAFSPDGRYLVSQGVDGTIVFWDWPGRRPIGQMAWTSSAAYIGFPTAISMLVVYDAQGFHAFSAPHARELSQLTQVEQAELAPPDILGPAARAVASELSLRVHDTDPGVRQAAAIALGEIRIEGPAEIDALASALRDRESDVRLAATVGLGELGTVAARAIHPLGELGTVAARAIHPLTLSLNDSDPSARIGAAVALGRVGSEARETVPTLVALLRSKETTQREAAAYALGQLGGNAEAAVPVLAQMLRDKRARTRQVAAFVLGQIGSHAKEAIGAIATAVRDRDAKVREVAIYAPGEVGDHDRVVIKALAGALKDREEENRRRALKVLASFGPSAKAVLPGLQAALFDRSSSAREAAMEAIPRVSERPKL